MSNSTVEDIYELSPLQQGILWHSLHDGAADMYLSQQTYAVEGPLDVAALVRAWQQVVAAHPVLRTSFHWQGLDKPLQVVHREVPLPVHHLEWSDMDADQQGERLRQLQAEDRAAGFDSMTTSLQRLHVIRLGDRRHTLIWTYHHLLLDGWSVRVFLDEVMSWYRALTLGTPPPQPVPAYRDYIAWLQRQDLGKAREFWTATLAGVRPSYVAQFGPADPQRGTGAVERRTVDLPASLADGLREAAARHRVTINTLVQAVWAIVVRCYTGQSEITFGCATSGRPAELPQVERMIGLFANTLPLRVTVPDDGDLGSWLRDIQSTHAAMRRYEYTPLADIKTWAGMPGQQLFDTLLVLENYALSIDAGAGDAAAEAMSFRVETLYDKIDLPLTLTVAPYPVSQMQLLLHRDRFEPGFVDDVLKRLHLTLSAVVDAERVTAVVAAAGTAPVRPPARQPAPAPDRPSAPAAPATPEEDEVAAVYREVLGITDIDVTASFFDLGGNSFDAVRAVSRLDGASVALLAANPSVRELARALGSARADDSTTGLDDEIADLERRLAAKRAARQRLSEPDRITPVPRGGPLPCTYQQESLWLLHQLNPASPVYHIPFVLRLRGALDVAALARSVHALITRHEALRTRFVAEDGLPRQVVDPPPAEFPLPVTELDPGQVEQWGADEAHRPFDLTRGPLLRVSLARIAPDEHVLVLVVHHIVADGWSLRVLGDELAMLYAAETGGDEARLAPPPLQAADYAAWERGRLDGAEMQPEVAYWRQALAGVSTIDFPTDRPRPAEPTSAGTPLSRRVPDDVAAAARDYARASQGSLLAVVHAAVLTVLHRYTGQEDLTIGTVFSGRIRPEIEPVVGFFASTLVLRTDVSGAPSFAELVRRCHQTVLTTASHQEVPFSLIVRALQPVRVPGRNPLFQICLTLQPAEQRPGLAVGATAEGVAIAGSHSRFDIGVDIFDSADRLDLKVEYSTELFDADRIERFLDHVVAALTGGLAAPHAPAADIDILPDAERHQVLHGWNDRAGGRPGVVRGLRHAFAGGDRPEPVALDRFLAAVSSAEGAVMPGAEGAATPGAGDAVVPGDDLAAGGAVPRTYILDDRMRPAPIGVPGRLFVGGVPAGARPGLAGPDAAPLPDPYASQPGQCMYATPVLARWRSDGVIEYLGAADRRVELRGERVQLDEIEYLLAKHPAVGRCAVLPYGDGHLAAYLVADPDHGDPDPGELADYLSRRLPTHLVPTAFVPLPRLPVAPDGGLDTARLPDPAPYARGYVAPYTPTQRWLATAWQELLGVTRVGALDNFFDLGGDSIQGLRLIARIRAGLHVELDPRRLFTNPVLERLAAEVDALGARPAHRTAR